MDIHCTELIASSKGGATNMTLSDGEPRYWRKEKTNILKSSFKDTQGTQLTFDFSSKGISGLFVIHIYIYIIDLIYDKFCLLMYGFFL